MGLSLIVRKIKVWLCYRETQRELLRLSDRELHDIGVTRCDIPFIARKNTLNIP
jgi:uncharacterized protein YjiS (DUF1127 family)